MLYYVQAPSDVLSWSPVPEPASCMATLASLEDGRTMLLYKSGEATAKQLTLPGEVVGVSGLCWEQAKAAVQVIQLTQSGEVLLVMLGSAKPRPKILGVLCNICGKKLNDRRNLTTHMKQHDLAGGLFVCADCGVVCRDSFFYKAHKLRCYFPCPFAYTDCKFKAKKRKDIDKHMQRKHKYDDMTF